MKNKLLTLLLAFMIAFGLWLYVITVVSPNSSDTIYDIPLSIAGETVLGERNLMITSNISDIKIDLTLSGNRSDLTQVNASNITLKADLSGIDKPGVHTIQYDVIYPGSVADNAFVVENSYPERITITVEKKEYAEIPVQIEWLGAVPEGFLAERENAVLDHEFVIVSGPSAVVSQIHHAKIQVDLTDRRESIDQSLRYTLCDAEGNPVDAGMITVNVEEVRVMLTVQRYKEVALVVTVEDGGGATRDTVSLEINPKTIKIAGSEAALEAIDEINLGTIKLAEYEEAVKLTYAIVLREGVVNLSNVTEATVDLQFPQLVIEEFTVDTFRLVGVPQGMKAEVITEKITIRVRGPESQVRFLREVLEKAQEDPQASMPLTAGVDLTNAQVGTTTYRVQIIFVDAFRDVGVLGKPQVTVTVVQR